MEGAGIHGDDGGLDPEAAGAAVDDEGDAAAEFLEDMGGGGGGDPAETVGAGGGDGAAKAGENGAKYRVGAHSHRNGREAGGDEVGDNGAAGEDEGERAGPEALDECLNQGVTGRGGEAVEPIEPGEMDDERVEEGAMFGLENAGYGSGIESVGGEAVDGFGGEGDHLAGGEKGGGFLDGVGGEERAGGHVESGVYIGPIRPIGPTGERERANG